MKPPRLPGTEKFRFCDKKYEQQKHDTFVDEHQTHNNLDKTDKITDDFLFTLSNHSLSSDSLCHSCTTTDGPPNKKNSINNHQKSYDSVSTTSSTLDEIINRVNLNDYPHHHRYGRYTKRKPNLPISSRMTRRVFNLTSYIRHLSDEEDDDDDEESDSFCPVVVASTTDNVKDMVYSTSKATTKMSESSIILSSTMATRNRSQQDQQAALADGSTLSSRSPTPSLISHDGSDTSSESISSKHLRTPDESHHLLISHHHHHHHIHHHHHHHRPIIIPAPSHASLMSDESSSSISLSTNREEFEDSLLRSSSCSPVVEHWAKCCGPRSNNSTDASVRLSTLSHSSWEEEENP